MALGLKTSSGYLILITSLPSGCKQHNSVEANTSGQPMHLDGVVLFLQLVTKRTPFHRLLLGFQLTPALGQLQKQQIHVTRATASCCTDLAVQHLVQEDAETPVIRH